MLRYFLLFSVLSGSIYAMNHHGGMMGNHTGNHTEHDEVNMPGLNGIDTTKQEVDDLKISLKIIRKLSVVWLILRMVLKLQLKVLIRELNNQLLTMLS